MIKRYYLHGFSVDCPEERADAASHEGSIHSLNGPRVHYDYEFQRFWVVSHDLFYNILNPTARLGY